MNVPYLTYDDVRQEAGTFLRKYHRSGEIPVPIEHIIEFGLNLHIVPVPGLYRGFNVSSYLLRDRSSIVVDGTQFDEFESKCRFTLGHEVGHYILHEEIYQGLPFTDTPSYIEWFFSQDPAEIGWTDTHADWFAGLILVPSFPLQRECKRLLTKHRNQLSSLSCGSDALWSYLSGEVARLFEVNAPVVEIRIRKDDLPTKLAAFVPAGPTKKR